MNQILKENNSYKNKKNQQIYIYIIVVVFILTILFVSSYKIYASNAYKKEEIIILSNVKINNVNIVNDSLKKAFEEKIVEGKLEEVIIAEETKNDKGYTVIANLNIPSLGINYPVLSSTSTELLKISLNKYWGANPNEVGNMCIVGHNYKNSKFFSKLPKIKKGEIVEITDLRGKTLKYKVYDTEIIDPYDTTCTDQLTNGNIEITLITCYNNGKQRFIAKARAF